MSEGGISEREPESYEDFVYRMQLAEGLPKDKRGIIIIGNTRAGKSTLALAMSGAAMKVVYESGELTYINPCDIALQDIVRNTHQSVTEKPNFYPSRPGQNKWAIVDMPGHADSSRFRELINFHYIRTMAANLEEVRFLLVVTVQHRNGRFSLPEKELQMLNSFRIMFPNCAKCVNIIINRVGDANLNTSAVSSCFRETVMHSNNISLFFGEITNSKIHVVERPAYRTGNYGEERHEAPYSSINKQMQEICNSDEAEFMRLSEHSYYTLNIFKAGDNTKNAEFYERLQKITKRIAEGVFAGATLFKKTLLTLLNSVITNGSCKPCQDQLIKSYETFLSKYGIQSPQKRELVPISYNEAIVLESSKVMQLLEVITRPKFIIKSEEINQEKIQRKALKYAEQWCHDIVNHYCSKLLQIVEQTWGRGKLFERVKDYYLFLMRRVADSYFIANILLEMFQNKKTDSHIFKLHQKIEEFQNIDEHFLSSFITLFDSLIKVNVPALFQSHSNSQFEQVKAEAFDNFNIIMESGSRAYKDRDIFENQIKSQIQQKKEEIAFFVIIASEPDSPQEVASQIEKLLRVYQSTAVNVRVTVLHKLARLMERQKEYKHAITLYLHLSLNEDAMRLLAVLQPSIKKEALSQVYSEVATAFQENAMFHYALRCLESAKRNSTDDPNRFIQFERRVLLLNDHQYTSKILKSRLENRKNDCWNWAKIDDQILFLKQRYRIKDNNPTKSILLKNYR